MNATTPLSAGTAATAIEITGLSKWFGQFQALKNVDLTVARGERIVVCGPSGSGKSTLIRCINRLEPHQQGRIVVNGVLPPLFSKEERRVLDEQGDILCTSSGDAALLAGRARAIRERVQAESLYRLAHELPVKPSFLPLLFSDAACPAAIRELARRLN